MAYIQLNRENNMNQYIKDIGSNNSIINSLIITINENTNNIRIENSNNIIINGYCNNILLRNCSNVTILNGSENIYLSNVHNVTIFSKSDVNMINTSNKEINENNVYYENNHKLINNILINESILDDSGGIDTVQTDFTNATVYEPGTDSIYNEDFIDSDIIEIG